MLSHINRYGTQNAAIAGKKSIAKRARVYGCAGLERVLY